MNKTISYSLGKKMFPQAPKDEDLICPYCDKHPSQIREYVEFAKANEVTVESYVKHEEGTYCQFTGCFVCTECYIKIGMPNNSELHSAFPYYRMEVNPLEGQDENVLIKYRLDEI